MTNFQPESEGSTETTKESPVKSFMRKLVVINPSQFEGLEEWDKEISLERIIEPALTRFNTWFNEAATMYSGQKGLTDEQVGRVIYSKSNGSVTAMHEATKKSATGSTESEAKSYLKNELVLLLGNFSNNGDLVEETHNLDKYKSELTDEIKGNFGLINTAN